MAIVLPSLGSAARVLGCATDYNVLVTTKTGRTNLGELSHSQIQWGRVQDDTSQATITVPTSGSQECCDLLSRMRAWGCELHLYRDGDEVWSGPLVTGTYASASAVLVARDILAWSDKRGNRTAVDYSTEADDLAEIGRAALLAGFPLDDANFLRYLVVRETGISGQRSYAAMGQYVGDILRDLAGSGLDVTVLGRSIILSGEGSLGTTAPLTESHFLVELQVVEDGLSAATNATVIGQGVVGTGGTAGPYGQLDYIVSESGILDQPSADAAAALLAAEGWPTPLYITVPDGARLAPDAPVTISDLVPGVYIPTTVDNTCRPVSTTMRLTKLDVMHTSDAGESVAITTVPAATEGLGGDS